eukprot:TRINITY_DN1927_c0_g1_i1.p1 TRINITY_DN1927_c0_g1~~TRINITY_DN1927_c0_g1_i1.p1  ORF type:complete len:463 (+),score=59.78 TRINITY_DN1927_c0_g1_i1:83-1471(+)
MHRLGVFSKHVVESAPLETDSRRPSPVATSSNAGGAGSAAGAPPMVVTLIASGNSGHVCAALIEGNTQGRVRTQILTSRPGIWKNKKPIVRFPCGEVQEGFIHKVSNNPAELIPVSDIVLWTGPVTSTRDVFESIRPYVNPEKTAVGTIFAQGLVHLLAYRVFGPTVRFFALQNIPWLCRMVKLGEESAIIGAKSSIGIMGVNVSDAWIKAELEPLFVTQKVGKWEPVMKVLPDFCPVVFNPANQIIHPARYWAMFRMWSGQPLTGDDEPGEWLYRNFDSVAGEVLSVLDEELQSLKNAYFKATGAEGCHQVIPLRERLVKQYGDQISDTSTMATTVGTNQAYSMAKTPFIRSNAGVMPNPNHRVVTDDIGWGLCVLISIAERLELAGIKTPTTMMKMLIQWHQELMGKEYLYDGRLRGRDCVDLVLLRTDDSLDLVARPPSEHEQKWSTPLEEDEDRIGNP